jgi:hypothetical protein
VTKLVQREVLTEPLQVGVFKSASLVDDTCHCV